MRHTTRPSPALVISLIALFVALGGTGYAAATGSIDGREIKNNTIQSKDVKNSSLTGADQKNNSLTGDDISESKLGKVLSATSADRAAFASSASTAGTATTAGNGVKAYGEVTSAGVVVAAKSKGISVSKIGTGDYCVKAAGATSATDPIVATPDLVHGSGENHTAQYLSGSPCEDAGGWQIRTKNHNDGSHTGSNPVTSVTDDSTTQADIQFSVVIP